MKMNYTPEQRCQLAEANINAAFDHLEELMDHPEKVSDIPDGAIALPVTGNKWVDQENEKIVQYWSEKEDRLVHRLSYQNFLSSTYPSSPSSK